MRLLDLLLLVLDVHYMKALNKSKQIEKENLDKIIKSEMILRNNK